jgi:serine phosphatase RsbU (regulator of sigma subunit)
VHRPAFADDVSWSAVLIGLLGLGVATVLAVVVTDTGQSPPIGILLIPVLGLALFASPTATALVAVVAVLDGLVIYILGGNGATDVPARFAILCVLTALAFVVSVVRRAREDRLRQQEAELAVAHERDTAERLLLPLLERLPELSGARDIPDVALRTCRIAREVFGADTASYWQLDGDGCVLLVREPAGDPSPPLVSVPRVLMGGDTPFLARTRSTWSAVNDLDEDDPRRELMRRAGAVVGVSTPVRVDFATVGYLALSWDSPQPRPERIWLESLDRLADEMALAKTVVRRQTAQQETRALTDRLQASFQPAHVEDVPHALVRLLYRPGTSQLLLGGDFLDVAVTDGEAAAFLMGDVSGHGPEQAALAATLRAAWRGAVSVRGSTLDERLAAMEAVIEGRRPTPGLFVTVVTGEIDASMSSMHYVCAGHPPPLLLPGAVTTDTGGPPLGILGAASHASRAIHKVDLAGRDGVLLVTDGLFEGYVAPGARERLGFDAFAELVGERCDWRDPDFLVTLADDLERRNGDAMSDDAAALLLLRRT